MSDLDKSRRSYEDEIGSVKQQMDDFKDSIEVYKAVMDDADKDIEVWEELKDNAEDGKTVFAPSKKPTKKRKSAHTTKKSRKRRETEDDSDAKYVSSNSEESNSEESNSEKSDGSDDESEVEAPKNPLTLEDIKTKIDDLRQSRKTACQEKAMHSKSLTDLKPKVRELRDKID
jgi:chromosome segregation ATPase